MNLSKGGQEPNVCIMPDMSVERKLRQPESKTYHAKASKCLHFSAPKYKITCVSSFSNKKGQLTGLTPLTNVGFSPIQCFNPLESRPQFTSTSIASLTMLEQKPPSWF